MRYAIVRNADSERQLSAYLPDNYTIVHHGSLGPAARPYFVIAGEDSLGWTLGDYVIPRLASGLIFATEISERDAYLAGFAKVAS